MPLTGLTDNRFILCNDANQHQLVTLTLDGNSQLRTINDTPYRRNQFRFSPDGKFVAYTSVESGSAQVFVASFPPSPNSARSLSMAASGPLGGRTAGKFSSGHPTAR